MKRNLLTTSEIIQLLPFGRTKLFQYRREGLFLASIEDEQPHWVLEDVKLWISAYNSGARGPQLKTYSEQLHKRRQEIIAAFIKE